MESAIARLERSSEVSATRRNRSDRSPTRPATQASAPSERTVSTPQRFVEQRAGENLSFVYGGVTAHRAISSGANYTTVQSPCPVEHEATTGLFRVRSEPGAGIQWKAHSRASASAMHARRRAAACAKRSRCRGQASGNGGDRGGGGRSGGGSGVEPENAVRWSQESGARSSGGETRRLPACKTGARSSGYG